MKTLFSIVIPAHNEEGYIGLLLNSLSNQRSYINSSEIIVVDNASSDGTQKEVKKFIKNYPKLNIKLISENRDSFYTGKGGGISRNTGARQAEGNILIFLDADNLVNETFLETIYQKAFRQNYEAGTIFTLPLEKSALAYLVFYILEMIKRLSIRPFGKNFVRKEIFQAVGGYDENLNLGENVEFLIRVKNFIAEKNRLMTHIKTPIYVSLRRFKKQGYLVVLSEWLLGYIGIRSIKYPRFSDL